MTNSPKDPIGNRLLINSQSQTSSPNIEKVCRLPSRSWPVFSIGSMCINIFFIAQIQSFFSHLQGCYCCSRDYEKECLACDIDRIISSKNKSRFWIEKESNNFLHSNHQIWSRWNYIQICFNCFESIYHLK